MVPSIILHINMGNYDKLYNVNTCIFYRSFLSTSGSFMILTYPVKSNITI